MYIGVMVNLKLFFLFFVLFLDMISMTHLLLLIVDKYTFYSSSAIIT